MGDTEIDRKIGLLQACWGFFDGVAARVSAEMRKGPRGRRARSRPDHPAHHPHRERGLRQAAGVANPEEGALTPKGLRDHRETYVATMRAYNTGEGKRMRSWNLPFLIRHTAPVSHARPHLGDGGQGPLRRTSGLTRALPWSPSSTATRSLTRRTRRCRASTRAPYALFVTFAVDISARTIDSCVVGCSLAIDSPVHESMESFADKGPGTVPQRGDVEATRPRC